MIKEELEESLDDVLIKKYKESCLKIPIVNASYIQLLSTNYLKKKILDFPAFAREQGYILEKDDNGWRMANIKDLLETK